MKSKYKKRLTAFLAVLLLAFPIVVHAEPIKTTAIEDKVKTWSTPSENGYDEKMFGDSSAPGNAIYGNTIKFKVYYGEVSPGQTDTEYRSTNIVNINDVDRMGPGMNDYHAKALETKPSEAAAAFCSGASSICSLPIGIVKISALLSNFDISMIFDLLITDTTLSNALEKVFLVGEDGKLAPILVVFLILFLFSLIFMIANYIKGKVAIQLIVKEIGFLILSVFIFAACQNDLASKLGNLGVDVSQRLSNALANDLTVDNEFWRGSGYSDTTTENVANETGIIAKCVIENQLCSLFKVDDISELDVSNTSATCVSNGLTDVHNIGYLYWAGSSRINEQNPVSGGKANFSGKNNNRKYYFIPDYLTELDSDVAEKAITALISPDWGSMLGNSFFTVLMSLSFAFIYLQIAILLFICSLIFVLVGVVSFILPALFLFPKTRDIATDIVRIFLYLIIFFTILLGFKSLLLVLFGVAIKEIWSSLIFAVIFFVFALKFWKMAAWFIRTCLRKTRFKSTIVNNFNGSFANATSRTLRRVEGLENDFDKTVMTGLGRLATWGPRKGVSAARNAHEKRKSRAIQQAMARYINDRMNSQSIEDIEEVDEHAREILESKNDVQENDSGAQSDNGTGGTNSEGIDEKEEVLKSKHDPKPEKPKSTKKTKVEIDPKQYNTPEEADVLGSQYDTDGKDEGIPSSGGDPSDAESLLQSAYDRETIPTQSDYTPEDVESALQSIFDRNGTERIPSQYYNPNDIEAVLQSTYDAKSTEKVSTQNGHKLDNTESVLGSVHDKKRVSISGDSNEVRNLINSFNSGNKETSMAQQFAQGEASEADLLGSSYDPPTENRYV